MPVCVCVCVCVCVFPSPVTLGPVETYNFSASFYQYTHSIDSATALILVY